MALKLPFLPEELQATSVPPDTPTLEECIRLLKIRPGHLPDLPFLPGDATAGSESELQAAVRGRADDVDLPLYIRQSSYYSNVIRRATVGDTSKKIARQLERYVNDTEENIWENSWVRMPCQMLNGFALEVLNRDLRAHKAEPDGPLRSDINRFVIYQNNETWLRLPISYLVKLSLADALYHLGRPHPIAESTGRRLLAHFTNDNTSPESFSFHVVSAAGETSLGDALAAEVTKRHLFTYALVQYANAQFRLRENGQEAMVFSSPSPPVRQQHLNDLLSDSFYRELFISPCLSGWDRGEAKYEYMKLCHKTLSRSHLNTLSHLKDAGIIANNLVVLPNTSNTSLANNGIHISLGSQKLTALRADPASGFERQHEKYLGDLVIKIVEHFLPLFVGRYSAAPKRFGFEDFHPERALGFLPHELDYTHLRMLWRRWKGKAQIKLLGKSITPFGPVWLDLLISQLFRLRGDFLYDGRLMDYLVALMSTESSPALNGRLDNDVKLKKDLQAFGVFDCQMSIYQLYKLREFDQMKFSGFEGRFYSLFPELKTDLSAATNLQALLTAFAYKLIVQGACSHKMIPDTPFSESERRQIFFGAAIGIPTFFVRKGGENAFMHRILARTKRTRSSRRYPGYIRVYHKEYQRALLGMLREEAADLIEMMQLASCISDLEERLENPTSASAWGKLAQGIMASSRKKSPMQISNRGFNEMAERYYQETLTQQHLLEGFDQLAHDLERMFRRNSPEAQTHDTFLRSLCSPLTPAEYLEVVKTRALENRLTASEWAGLIQLMLLFEHIDANPTRSS